MPDVTMPRLSDSMEEGTILKWLKAEGDEVAKGDELVEIETDKATMTYEADSDGTLEIVAEEGSTLSIGEVIARIGEGGGASSDDGESESESDDGESESESESDDGESESDDSESESDDGGDVGTAEAEAEEDEETDKAPSAGGNGGRPKASPVARRI